MKGIPTKYQHRRYRSRLEARWACFFDLLGWKYEYEPYDLNGWIPDFCIYGSYEILVEVKPYSKQEEFNVLKMEKAKQGSEKESNELLLLGSTIFESESWGAFHSKYRENSAYIGWLCEYYFPEEDECLSEKQRWISPAVMNFYEGKWGFFHSDGSYTDRVTGAYEGDSHLHTPSYSQVLQLWNEAGNKTQWKA